MTKEKQDPFSLCEDEEKSYKEEKESIKREEMERVINTSETVKREADNRNNESELRNPSSSFSKSTATDSFPIKDKESRRIHL